VSREFWAVMRRAGVRLHRTANQERRRQEAQAEAELVEKLRAFKDSEYGWMRVHGDAPVALVERACRKVPGLYYSHTTEDNVHIVKRR
jgi:hypothetical protein